MMQYLNHFPKLQLAIIINQILTDEEQRYAANRANEWIRRKLRSYERMIFGVYESIVYNLLDMCLIVATSKLLFRSFGWTNHAIGSERK